LHRKVWSSGANAVEGGEFVGGWQWGRNVDHGHRGYRDEPVLHGGIAQADG